MLCRIDSFSQNFVPDSSFEADTACPQAQYITNNAYWKNPTTASPDYFHVCSSSFVYAVPNNYIGNQNANSGGAYVGLVVKSGADYKEYVQVDLVDTLQTGRSYCVSFYVNLAGRAGYGSIPPQLYFSDSAITSSSTSYFSWTPQISSSVIITDTTNWVQISGTYIANGGEKYITIGNFYSDANTASVVVNPFSAPMAYYYVDDVSVIDCSSSGIYESGSDGLFSIYPNPSGGTFTIQTQLSAFTISIYNSVGQIIFRSVNVLHINISGLPSGLYFIEIKSDKTIERRKIIIET